MMLRRRFFGPGGLGVMSGRSWLRFGDLGVYVVPILNAVGLFFGAIEMSFSFEVFFRPREESTWVT